MGVTEADGLAEALSESEGDADGYPDVAAGALGEAESVAGTESVGDAESVAGTDSPGDAKSAGEARALGEVESVGDALLSRVASATNVAVPVPRPCGRWTG